MNRMVRGLVLSTGALALTAIYLLWLLESAREQSRAEHERRLGLEERVEQLEKERAALERKVQSLRRFGQSRADSSSEPPLHPAAGLLPARAGAGSAPLPPEGMQPPMQPPPMTSEQHKLMARRSFGELFRELALSPQQVDALLALFASHQERLESSFRSFAPLGTQSAEELENGRKAFEQLNQRHNAEIAGVIGPEKAAEFEALKQTIPMRHELKQVRDHLEAVGTPVSDEQKGKLLAIMREQKTAMPMPALNGAAHEDAIDQLRAWRSETSRRFRESAASVLSPAQLKELEAYDAWQASSMFGMVGNAVAIPPLDSE